MNLKKTPWWRAALVVGFGSIVRLWKKHYQHSIDFVKLRHRKFFYIQNPQLASVDLSFEKYYFDSLNE